MRRPPTRHPETGTPAARIDDKTVFWFGCPVARLYFDDHGIQVAPLTDESRWNAGSGGALLRHYGQMPACALTGKDGRTWIHWLGDPLAPVTELPGGVVFAGRWFKAAGQAAFILAQHGGEIPEPEIHLTAEATAARLDVSVRGRSVGIAHAATSGGAVLQYGGTSRDFPTVPKMIRWISNRYGARNPADDDPPREGPFPRAPGDPYRSAPTGPS